MSPLKGSRPDPSIHTPTSGLSRRSAVALAAASALGAGVSARGSSAMEAATPAPVDARAFGAVCDGRTNDAPAIQAALDEAPCVELPYGVYCIKEPLRINTGQRLLGCGSTLRGMGDHEGIRRGRDPRFGDRFIEFPVVRDLSLESFSVGLQAEGMSWGNFQGLRVSQCQTGYRLATGDEGTCYYNSFTSCHVGADVDVGVRFRSMANRRFPHPDTREPRVVGANGNLFQGCKIGGESACLVIDAPVKNLVFTGCSIERARAGIILVDLGTHLEPGGEGKARSVAFFGCNFEGGAEVNGVFQGGRLRLGLHAEDCSFFAPTIPGGVVVEDAGHLTNWFPTGAGRGGIHELFALDPANASARIGDVVEGRPFASVYSRRLRIDLDGTLEWRGPGVDKAPYISLRSSAGGILRTDENFLARRLLARAVIAHDAEERETVRLEGADR